MKLENMHANMVLEDGIPTGDLESKVKHDLIPQMMRRRGRVEPLSQLEVVNRLFSILPEKPGEVFELFVGEFQANGFTVTPSMASEIADIVYYTAQPNCPIYLQDPSLLFEHLGVTMDRARIFCLLKYQTRLRFGNEPNYKEIEEAVLSAYLQREVV